MNERKIKEFLQSKVGAVAITAVICLTIGYFTGVKVTERRIQNAFINMGKSFMNAFENPNKSNSYKKDSKSDFDFDKFLK